MTISSKSYTWWSDADEGVDPRIPGFTSGILEQNSGTFDDLENRGGGERVDDFTAIRWYNKNRPDYAIDATGATVIAAVSAIDSNLPENNQNAFKFAKAAFDYIRENIEYYTDPGSGSPALSDLLVLQQAKETVTNRRTLSSVCCEQKVFQDGMSLVFFRANPTQSGKLTRGATSNYQCQQNGAMRTTSNWIVVTLRHLLM